MRYWGHTGHDHLAGCLYTHHSVTNSGDSVIYLKRCTFTGDSPIAFLPTTSIGSAPLPSGESCTVTAECAPSNSKSTYGHAVQYAVLDYHDRYSQYLFPLFHRFHNIYVVLPLHFYTSNQLKSSVFPFDPTNRLFIVVTDFQFRPDPPLRGDLAMGASLPSP